MSVYNCSSCEGSGWSGYNETQCYRITTSAATAPSTPLTAQPTSYYQYSTFGSYFYVEGSNGLTGNTYAIVNGVAAWDNVGSTSTEGPLNRCGIWPTTGGLAPPYNTWIGFSTCLSGISETKIYWIGIAADNKYRLKLDGVTVIQSLTIDSKSFKRWNVYPIEIGAGNHTLEAYALNEPNSEAGFGCEIYDGDLATLTGITTYSALLPYVKFTSSGQTLFSVVQDTNGNYLSSGYTCSSGYTYSICDNACVKYEYCDKPPTNCESTYCVSNTGYPTYNGLYNMGGDYNNNKYWSGQTSGLFMYYNTGSTRWCLSTTLGGTCLLSGKSPCYSECPDFYNLYLSSGSCPTPTPTPTNNCSILDFNSFFNCEPVSFITPTPTSTPTPTPTTTVTPTNFCYSITVDAEINDVPVTPTPTSTPTPTPTPIINRDCNFSGDVTFNTINISVNCPISKQFSDCNDPNTIFTTTNVLNNPSGGQITQYMVFNATVNGLPKCISYIGETYETVGGDTITLTLGPLGYSNVGGCSSCSPTRTPTPTPTITPTLTPTTSVTPTLTPSRTPTKTPTKSVTPTITPTKTPTKTPTPTVTQTPTITPTKTPTPTVTQTPTITKSQTPTKTPTPTVTPTPTGIPRECGLDGYTLNIS